jgi:hypothetical protein
MTVNTNSAAFDILVDDLLWVYQRGLNNHDQRTDVDAMIADYTADPDHYSDGSPVGAEYIPDHAPNVIAWGSMPPPHRRQTS